MYTRICSAQYIHTAADGAPPRASVPSSRPWRAPASHHHIPGYPPARWRRGARSTPRPCSPATTTPSTTSCPRAPARSSRASPTSASATTRPPRCASRRPRPLRAPSSARPRSRRTTSRRTCGARSAPTRPRRGSCGCMSTASLILLVRGTRSLAARRRALTCACRHALQLRQAKLAFPNVQLAVGVFPDGTCERYGHKVRIPHVERCELVRHCRWVDEVVEDAPWRIDDAFLSANRIDYVAIDEGASVDPAYDKERVKGYDLVKSLREYFTYLVPPLCSPLFMRGRQSYPDKAHSRAHCAELERGPS